MKKAGNKRIARKLTGTTAIRSFYTQLIGRDQVVVVVMVVVFLVVALVVFSRVFVCMRRFRKKTLAISRVHVIDIPMLHYPRLSQSQSPSSIQIRI